MVGHDGSRVLGGLKEYPVTWSFREQRLLGGFEGGSSLGFSRVAVIWFRVVGGLRIRTRDYGLGRGETTILFLGR